jgi:hypothetical protein
MSVLVSAGMVISHASLDKFISKEMELEEAIKQVASLQHQFHYYQEVGEASNLVKDFL